MSSGYQRLTSLPSYDHKPVATPAEIDRLLIEADYSLLNDRRHVAVISIAIIRILRGNPQFNLRYIESRLRHLQSATYLLAVPAKYAPNNVTPKRVPGRQPAKYFLWICLNGAADAEAQSKQFGIDQDTNADRLEETGMAFLKNPPVSFQS